MLFLEVCTQRDTFVCKRGECVPKNSICGENDNCDGIIDEFSCKSGQCLTADTICDGEFNCKDKSDEDFSFCQGKYQHKTVTHSYTKVPIL